jgi:DDE superfamily endonuclease
VTAICRIVHRIESELMQSGMFRLPGKKALLQGLYDSGYQGINQYHSNSYTPKKKPKKGELSILEKDYNRVLAKERIGIEHINRRLKIFKIFGDRYRNRRRRYGLRCNLLAAIYNYELQQIVINCATHEKG